MPRLLVHDKALDDVQSIAHYIARENLSAALRFYDAAQLAFDFLVSMPGAGPQLNSPFQSIPDLRFWPISRFRNYLVLYKSLPDGVEILRVIHGARDISSIFSD
ncbi:MAG TPA: type II toxin-antitoxin system RelE/ParE family toxin [Tepidisphaeraceae bacterium]